MKCGAFFVFSIISIGIWLVFSGCETQQEKVRDYNNKIVLVLTDAGLRMQKLDEALFQNSRISEQYQLAKQKADSCSSALNEIGLYNKDTTLINPAKKVIDTYQDLLKNEYQTLVQFHTSPQNEVTFEWVDSTRVLRMNVQNKSTFVQLDFENAQQSFADRYLLHLIE
jgi:hypothetical protein